MLRSDPELPALSHAFEPHLVAGALQQAMARSSSTPPEIVGCSLQRFRYKRGERAIFVYELRLRDPDAGPDRRHLVTGRLYKGKKAKRVFRRLAAQVAEGHESPATGPVASPYYYLKDLGMLVEAFPADRHLTTLAETVRPAPQEVANALNKSNPPTWICDRADIDVVRYRPGIAATLAITVRQDGAGAPGKRAFLKVYRTPAAAETAHESWRRLGDAARRSSGAFTVARPLAHLHELGAIIFPAAEGDDLVQWLESRRDIGAAARRAGRALTALHNCNVGAPNRVTLDSLSEQAARDVEILEATLPALHTDAAAIVRLAGGVQDDGPSCVVHGDLKADHVFLAGDKVSFIDLDSAAIANPAFDWATLIARLEALPDGLREPARRLQGLLLRQFVAPAGNDWVFSAYFALALLEAAVSAVRRLKPGWRETVTRLVRLASGALGDGEATLAMLCNH